MRKISDRKQCTRDAGEDDEERSHGFDGPGSIPTMAERVIHCVLAFELIQRHDADRLHTIYNVHDNARSLVKHVNKSIVWAKQHTSTATTGSASAGKPPIPLFTRLSEMCV